jgi:hypothetical protein
MAMSGCAGRLKLGAILNMCEDRRVGVGQIRRACRASRVDHASRVIMRT